MDDHVDDVTESQPVTGFPYLFNPFHTDYIQPTFSEFVCKFLYLFNFKAFLHLINRHAVLTPADQMQKCSEIRQIKKFTNKFTEYAYIYGR